MPRKKSVGKNQCINLQERIPNVLFVGNGVCYNKEYCWNNLINVISERKEDELQSICSGEFKVPNNILSFALFPVDDKTRKDKYLEALNGYKYPSNDKIDKLIKLPFDAILTTNYTYEFENAYDPSYSTKPEKKKVELACYSEYDNKYLIHIYNRLENGIPIWHVHGELRRKSSMIMSHDEYARLIERMIDYNTKSHNKYEKDGQNLPMNSWIDYFIAGNVFLLGFSLDYSEFDIWWLIGRKLRERAKVGQIYFYEPATKDNKNKHEVLKMRDIKVESLGFDFSNGDNNYDDFYMSAIDDIASKL